MTKSTKQIIRGFLTEAAKEVRRKLNIDVIPPVYFELPREKNHGDISSNISFLISSKSGIPSKKVADAILEDLAPKIHESPLFNRVETAGGGFINFFLNPAAFYPVLLQIDGEGEKYGFSDVGTGTKVLVEFVSANPTGPLHIGHARNAVVGDVLTNILAACGFEVRREYYLNDVGTQVEALGKSLKSRYMELLGEEKEADIEYKGEYLVEISRELFEKNGTQYRDRGAEVFTGYAVKRIREGIGKDLEDFGVVFDSWFSEEVLHSSGSISKALSLLEEKGLVEFSEGAKWFKSSEFGDEKDRVVIRSDGSPTYLAADISYHYRKFNDGYDRLINVWGADHHGYIPRLKGVIEALGFSPGALDIVLIQLVKLSRSGKPVPMSTRAGEFVTLREVIDEVGKDSMRFFLLMRRSDAQLDFDLELAKKESPENPVYYVQYAHARTCSLLSFAEEEGLKLRKARDVRCELLKEEEELDLIKVLSFFPEVVEGSARSLEPHRLTGYLQRLASSFHNFYDRVRVVGEEEEKALARLALVRATQTTLQNGLRLLGISAPERM